MVLEKLGESLRNTLKKITNSVFVDEKLIEELVRDIQRALLVSDVNVSLVFELTTRIKKRALEEKTPTSISKKEHLVKIVYEELVAFLGSEQKGIVIKENKKPFKILMVGLFGSGKTTSIGKLAKYYTKRGHSVAALGLDVHRPAAMEQLEQICKTANIACFVDKKEKNPTKIYKNFEKEYLKYDLLIIDSSGRDALSKDLIEEIESLNKTINPDERILVISADIGQAAKMQAEAFHKSVSITGVIITKLDGTAKAGGALSACAVTGAPVKFIGIGEKIDDLEEFDPEGFVGRLLGMGDIKALISKASEAMTQEQATDLGKKFLKGDFNFLDLYEQMMAIRKMGPLSKIVELIPGMSSANIPKEMLSVQEEKLKKWKFIFQSMTREELENPEILTRNRIDRISSGSGSTASEIRELLKQYRQSKKLVKVMGGSAGKEPDMNKIMRKFGKKQIKF